MKEGTCVCMSCSSSRTFVHFRHSTVGDASWHQKDQKMLNKKRPLVRRRRCPSTFKNVLSQLDRRPREMPGLNQDAAPVVCKLTLSWTGATDMSPPGVALTSQGRYVINSGARVSALCTAVENDLKQLLFRVVFMETAGQNRKLGTLSVLTQAWHRA